MCGRNVEFLGKTDVTNRQQCVYSGEGLYEGRTESHEQLFFFACELGAADEGECGGRWNQLLCYP